MKKSKLLVLGLIGLMMMVGLVLFSCKSKCDGNCVADAVDNWAVDNWSKSKPCTTYDYCYDSCKAMKNWDKRGSGTTYKCDCL